MPLIKPDPSPAGDGGGAGRARVLAGTLAVGCLAWLPFRMGPWSAGAAAPLFETLFTLIFVSSAVFLAAGATVLGGTARTLTRSGLVLAPLLLAMYLRRWWPQLEWFYVAVPVAGAVVLAMQSRQGWSALKVVDQRSAEASGAVPST